MIMNNGSQPIFLVFSSCYRHQQYKSICRLYNCHTYFLKFVVQLTYLEAIIGLHFQNFRAAKVIRKLIIISHFDINCFIAFGKNRD